MYPICRKREQHFEGMGRLSSEFEESHNLDVWISQNISYPELARQCLTFSMSLDQEKSLGAISHVTKYSSTDDKAKNLKSLSNLECIIKSTGDLLWL